MIARPRRFLSVNNGDGIPDIQIVGLSAPIRHTFQALSALVRAERTPLGITEIARRHSLPEAALSKCFQRLAHQGILESQRGPGGGYRLSLPAEKITLKAVIEALEGQDIRRGRCLLEERDCSSGGSCALHAAAVEADARMKKVLSTLTLADLKKRPISALGV